MKITRMKTTRNLLVAGTVAALCCSLGDAQTIYSDNFSGGATNIFKAAPNYAVTDLGGSGNAVWYDAAAPVDSGSLLANGVDSSASRDSWLLPFSPESGQVYNLTATLNFSGDPGNWVGIGFAQNYTDTLTGNGWFVNGETGYAWVIATESTGNVQAFGGPGINNPLINQNGFFTAGVVGSHTLKVTLDTTGPQWTMTAFVDGVQAGPNFTYSPNPSIGAVGITQNNLSAPTDVQWTDFTLSAVAVPEPSALALTGAGFAVILVVALCRRRRYAAGKSAVRLISV